MKQSRWCPSVLRDWRKLHAIAKKNDEASLKAFLSTLDENSIICLIETVCNMAKGNVSLHQRQLQKLRPCINGLRRASKVRRIGEARTVLIQHGSGFIVPFIPVAISVLSSLLSHVLQ